MGRIYELLRINEEQVEQYRRHGLARIDVPRFRSNEMRVIDLSAIAKIETPHMCWQKPGHDNGANFAKIIIASSRCHHHYSDFQILSATKFERGKKVLGLEFRCAYRGRFLAFLSPVYD